MMAEAAGIPLGELFTTAVRQAVRGEARETAGTASSRG